MTDDEECPHGLDARWCSVCLHGVSKPENVTVEYVFAAYFPGHCGGCNLPYARGTRVAKLSNGRYVHEGCASSALPSERRDGLGRA